MSPSHIESMKECITENANVIVTFSKIHCRYRETISQKQEELALSKSPNKHMYMDIVLFCEGSLVSNEVSRLQENAFIVELYVPARNCALLDTQVGRIGVSVANSFDQWRIAI
jgi:translation elongation factor EF-G